MMRLERRAASADAASTADRADLVETFGFDPTRWNPKQGE
jgi:hypothetical protein